MIDRISINDGHLSHGIYFDNNTFVSEVLKINTSIDLDFIGKSDNPMGSLIFNGRNGARLLLSHIYTENLNLRSETEVKADISLSNSPNIKRIFNESSKLTIKDTTVNNLYQSGSGETHLYSKANIDNVSISNSERFVLTGQAKVKELQLNNSTGDYDVNILNYKFNDSKIVIYGSEAYGIKLNSCIYPKDGFIIAKPAVSFKKLTVRETKGVSTSTYDKFFSNINNKKLLADVYSQLKQTARSKGCIDDAYLLADPISLVLI
ncbi:hypothetical protein OAT67_00800 [Bacteriovoracaceae bacterium]|nr:hypothetical protein [Bacteriovoracaceae bacterium]